MQMLGIPAAVDQFAGQPVQQFGMAGWTASSAEILGSFHQSLAERLLPEPIGGDASGERMTGVNQPAGQA